MGSKFNFIYYFNWYSGSTVVASEDVMFYVKNVFLEILQNSQENTCASLFFKKVAGLQLH